MDTWAPDILSRLFYLIVGSYVFTATVTAAGASAFFYLYRLITNHQEHRFQRIEKFLGLKKDD